MTSAVGAAGVVEPDYAGRGLASVLPNVAGAVGLEGWPTHLRLPPALRYVVVLVDGLGHRLLQKHADEAPYLAGLAEGTSPLTVGVPSTTATSLTSLGTGLPPGGHGVVGYTSRIPGTDRTLNALRWPSDVDATQWQPHTGVLERIAESGVPASSVNKAEFEGSGLTLCSQRGVPFHGVTSVWERLEAVADLCEAEAQGVVYAYESTLDHAGHEHGCTSEQWRERLRAIDGDLRHLRDALPDDTAMLVTADHGMVDLPLEGRFDVDAEPHLLDDVVVLAGEARFRHLYTRTGAEADVAGRWAERLGEQAVVLTRDDAERRGWFGEIEPRVRPRIGDVVVASLGDFGVFTSERFKVEMKMRGFHGSVTADEMLVPLLVDPPR
ncbi:alkaline phosphatase family protein [Solicola sp. PLA-1-18]|uniref:alkaline phosphatase family protein n=1 Tax=Solicola sp. PLA-1-18 TaxID=3380532 RepID=UPI003B80BBC2